MGCECCGTPFAPRGRKKFCSRKCKEYKYKGRSYRVHKETKCSHCGFIALHPCQLDVDHIDGNHMNDAPENLQTLCANCHRLKTFVQRWV